MPLCDVQSENRIVKLLLVNMDTGGLGYYDH